MRDALKELSDLGLAVVGISPDPPATQKKFDEKHGLAFPLLSDPDHAVARAFGAWGEKSMRGKKFEGVIRSSFLIDREGRVIRSWYKVKPDDTIPKALDALKDIRA